MSKYIERFDTSDRVFHWVATLSFLTLMLSGVGLYSRLFTGYFSLFGGGQGAILVHKWAGVIFFFSSLIVFFKHFKELVSFDEDDSKWMSALGGYLSKDPEHLNNGKYNAGQKVFGLFVGIATFIMGITGWVMWSPQTFSRGTVQASLMIHGLLFVLFVMFVVLHGYLTTIGNPGTMEGMLWGRVKKIWAKTHHGKWFKEVESQSD